MAKQTFTTGQVLTAAQMTSLQQTAMGGGSATAKTASYTLVAADAGTTVIMNSASATTITVNTSLFSAGDTVFIQNIGAGISTITAGTATVNTSASLALAQYEGGTLYFTSASASLFFKADGAAAGGGKVLQVVQAETSTLVTVASTAFTDAGLTASITPTANTSKILVIYNQNVFASRATTGVACAIQLLRGATSIQNLGFPLQINIAGSTNTGLTGNYGAVYLDSPATTSATTYKTQIALNTTANSGVAEANNNNISSITLLEIGA